MRTVGLFEAKQKLSELVERAGAGERIGITKRGKLTAVIVSANPEISSKETFDGIEGIRKRRKAQDGVTAQTLIEEGRR
ncbi:MAG: type II toxin-antitoxin system Phd/YefM family antitoxin [Candidatus Acidiferrales bacterium]